MSEDTRYNGWANRETWLVVLWLDNEPYYQEAVLESLRSNGYTEPCVDADNDIKATVQDIALCDSAMNDIASLSADLINHSLAAVDWREVSDMVFESYADELDIDSEDGEDY